MILHPKSSDLVIVFAIGLLVGFFLPWVQFLGFGISGYSLGKLGSYGNYAWIIPILASSTLIASFTGRDNRSIGTLTGVIPIVAILYLVANIIDGRRDAEDILEILIQVISIGGWITIICSLGLLIGGSLPSKVPEVERMTNMVKDFSDRNSPENNQPQSESIEVTTEVNQEKESALTLFDDANKLYNAELYKEALSLYKKVIEKDPTFYKGYYSIAKCQIKLHSFEKGLKTYLKHINLIPAEDRATYSVGLAGILLEEGEIEKAFGLVEDYGKEISSEQLPTFLKILLANGNINLVLLHLLNLSRSTTQPSGNPPELNLIAGTGQAF
jgi:hypothetical protein